MSVVVADEAVIRRVVAEEVRRALKPLLEALGQDDDAGRALCGGDLLTAAEVAKLLRIDARTLRRMVRAGEVPPPITIGDRTHRWRRRVIESWLRRLEQRA